MHKLFQKDPAVHKHLKKPVSSRTTPVSEQAWQDHINNPFYHPSPSKNGTRGSHNGASGGTGPHPFNLPGKLSLPPLSLAHFQH
eukprot:1152000-Pelagomonas_calceolata.AAC.2